MALRLKAPAASDDPTVLADFLELSAIQRADKNSSMVDLMRALRQSGSVDALDSGDGRDGGSEQTEACADAAFSEVEDRIIACGDPPLARYPFGVNENRRVLMSSADAATSVYGFMLLMSAFGLKAGSPRSHPERTFEAVCCHAAAAFLGGKKRGAEAVRFGSPRTTLPSRFADALDEVCARAGEMEPSRRKLNPHAKDAQLDIVAWRHFPDRRPGKLMAFGQCAAGRNGRDVKAKELQIASFTKRWLSVVPSVDPLRMFFVPWRVPQTDHEGICIDGGVVLDRCRIALLSKHLDAITIDECARWSRGVLKSWKR